jgi:hypothetical protein
MFSSVFSSLLLLYFLLPVFSALFLPLFFLFPVLLLPPPSLLFSRIVVVVASVMRGQSHLTEIFLNTSPDFLLMAYLGVVLDAEENTSVDSFNFQETVVGNIW